MAAGTVPGAVTVGAYVPDAKGQLSPLRANMWFPDTFAVQLARAPDAAASARSAIAALATSRPRRPASVIHPCPQTAPNLNQIVGDCLPVEN